MGQEEIIQFLDERYQEEPGRWWTSNDMSEYIDTGATSLSVNLKKLRKQGDVSYQRLDLKGKGKERYLYRKRLWGDIV